MKIYNTALIVLALSISFISCQQDACYNKNQFVNSYKAFFDEFEKNSDDLSKTDKKQYEVRYEKLLENCYKNFKSELSYDERKEFWKSSISFYLEKEGGIFNIRFNEINDDDPLKKYIIAEIEEMSDSTTHEFADFLETVLDEELPDLIDSFVDKVGELGDELKKSLEKKD
jgi:hypothetical protein